MTPAKKRRAYGSGSITQRADGLWIGRVYAPGWTENGTRRRITRSGKTRAIVEGKLRQLTRDIREGQPPTPGKARTTVRAWALEWLPRHALTAKPKYYATDAGNVNKWIIPAIGHRRLAELTPGDVRALRAAVTKPEPPRFPNGRSTTTAHAVHSLFVRMLKDAALDGHSIDKSLLLVKRPKKARSDRTAMTVDELRQVLEVIARRPDRARWVCAILTGTRLNETLGLTWACVDLDRTVDGVPAPQLDVSWQKQELPYNVKGDRSSGFRVPDGFESRQLVGAVHLTRPKTASGDRVIPIVPWLAEHLAALRQQWVPNPWDLIWTDTLQSGQQRPVRDDADRARWHAIQKEAGVAHPSGRPYHLHETRHSVVSMLLAAGVDRSIIQALVGQSKLLDAYVHVVSEQSRAPLGRFADTLQLGASPITDRTDT